MIRGSFVVVAGFFFGLIAGCFVTVTAIAQGAKEGIATLVGVVIVLVFTFLGAFLSGIE